MPEDNIEKLQKQVENLQRQLSELKKATAADDTDSRTVSQKLFWLESLLHHLNIQVQSNDELYIPLAHLVGYALLGLALIDYINIFVPSYFTNPLWELQMITLVIDRVPLPLVGIMLVFYGHRFRSKPEKILMRILAWASLAVGILYLLLIPLEATDSYRVNNQYNLVFGQQLTKQTLPLENLKQKVNAAQSEEELTSILNSQKTQAAPPIEIKRVKEFKETLLANINKASAEAKKQSDAELKRRQESLLQDAVRYLLGCLICGAFFISIGRIALTLIPE